jgi:hypothetical protein
MDAAGHGDPYFKAKIDDRISFTYVLFELSET